MTKDDDDDELDDNGYYRNRGLYSMMMHDEYSKHVRNCMYCNKGTYCTLHRYVQYCII